MPLAVHSFPVSRLGALVVLGTILIFLASNPFGSGNFDLCADEVIYYRQAEYLREHGMGGVRELVYTYEGSWQARQYPVPVRVGYIGLIAALFGAFGSSAALMGYVSLFSFFCFLIVNYYFFRRNLPVDQALGAILLLASSPLLLGMSRRGLTDIPVAFLWAWALWLVYEIIERGASLRKGVLLFCVVLFAFLVKESAVFLMITIAGVVGIRKLRGSLNVDWKALIYPIFLAFVCYIFILFLLLGDLKTFLLVVNCIGSTQAILGQQHTFASDFCSGPWFKYLLDFLLLVPLEVILACGFVFYVLAQKGRDRLTSYWLFVAVLIYGFFSLMPHAKVVRMVAVLEVPLVLFAVKGLFVLFENYQKGRGRLFLTPLTAIVILAVINFQAFILIFFSLGIAEPISYHLLIARYFFPLPQT